MYRGNRTSWVQKSEHKIENVECCVSDFHLNKNDLYRRLSSEYILTKLKTDV